MIGAEPTCEGSSRIRTGEQATDNAVVPQNGVRSGG